MTRKPALDPARCERCGEAVSISYDGPLATIVCTRCGHRVEALATFADAPLDPDASRADRVELVLRFRGGRPSAEELTAARALVPELARVPMNELLAKARLEGELSVGTFSEPMARQLMERGRKSGIDLRVR